MSRFLRKLSLAAGLALLMWAPAAQTSLRVNPLIVNMAPTGQGSSSVVQLTNVTDADLPLEVTVVKRTVVDGAEVDVAADDDFIIFPPQMILKPGQTQALRIQWVKGAVPATSESYYVYVTQIPAPLNAGMSGVKVSYRFGISVHMVPPGVMPNLQVVGIKAALDQEGKPGFELTVRNAGTAYARMVEHEMTIGKAAHTWSRDDIKKIIGTGFMLPGQQRTFFVPFEGEAPAPSMLSIEYRGAA